MPKIREELGLVKTSDSDWLEQEEDTKAHHLDI